MAVSNFVGKSRKESSLLTKRMGKVALLGWGDFFSTRKLKVSLGFS